MPRPRDVFLYGDDGEATRQAEALLAANNIRWMKTDVRVMPQPEITVLPTIITPIGTLRGIEGVEYYIADLKRFPKGLPTA